MSDGAGGLPATVLAAIDELRSPTVQIGDVLATADTGHGSPTPSTYWIDVTYLVERALESSRTGDSSPRSERTDP
jgi:hypothetical protein